MFKWLLFNQTPPEYIKPIRTNTKNTSQSELDNILQPALSAGKRVWAKARVVLGLFLIGWICFWLFWLVRARCTWFWANYRAARETPILIFDTQSKIAQKGRATVVLILKTFFLKCTFKRLFISLLLDRAESVDESSDRQLRLGAVRSLFLQLYFKAVGCTNKFETGSSFSSIFDQVTEKIREGWGTVV